MYASKIRLGKAHKTLAVVFFAVITVALLGGGWWYYQSQARVIRQNSYETVAAIGRLKVGQIVQWRKERFSDTLRTVNGPVFKREALEIFQHSAAPGVLEEARKILTASMTGELYSNVFLVDPEGAFLLAAKNESVAALSPIERQALNAALASQEPVLSDFFRETNGHVHIDTLAALRDAGGKALGAVILRCNAEDYLYPLIQSWPTPSRSAETLLVERQGEELVFLNELRHRAQTALSLRQPLSWTTLPAVQAVLGKRGMFEGRDYRNVEVLADLCAVPGTPWVMVAKVDRDEILAELSYRAAITGSMAGVLILLAAAATAFTYKRRQAGIYQQLLKTELQQQQDQEQYRATLYSIGDGVLTVDTESRVREMNPVAERLTGWSEIQARGKPMEEVFVIINQETRAKVINPVATVLREGVVVGLANHTVLIARDGTEHAIADSAAPIHDKNGNVSGVVLVFSDVTEQYKVREALRRSEREYRMLFEGMLDGFALHEMICDESGQPIDYRFLSMNPAFERMTGLRAADILGRTVREVLPGIEPVWIERYGRVALTGEPVHFEEHSGALGRHYEVTAYCPQPGQFAVVIEDITERKAAEDRIAHLTQLYAALSECNQAIVHCTSVEELLPKICQTAVQFGGMKMAWIGLVDEETQRITPAAFFGDGTEYLEGLEISTNADDPLGRGPTGTAIRENQPFWNQDFLNDPCTAPWHERGARYGWASSAALPLHKGGKTVGVFTIYHDKSQSFDEEVRKLLVEMAYDISFALDNFAREAERRKAEEARRKSEERLNFALQTVHIGAWELDLRDHTAHRDLNHDRIFGYETLLPNWTFEMFLEHVLPEDRPEVERCFHEAIATKSEWNFECRIRRADGEVRWIWAAGDHERNTECDPVRIAGIVQDITERKRTEEALRESEVLYRSLFENMLNGFAYCQMVFEGEKAADVIYLAVNAAFTSQTGLQNVIGKRITEVIPGIRGTDQQLLDTYGRVAKTGQPEYFETFVAALQMWFAVAVYSPASGYIVVVFDVITERKQAEEALRQNRNMLAQVLNTVPQSVFWKDRNSVYMGCNEAFAQDVGLASPTEIVGKTDFDLPWPSEHMEGYIADDMEVMANNRPKLHIIEPYQEMDGTHHWADTSKVPLTDSDGNVYGVLGVYEDITERRQMEQALIESQHFTEGILNMIPVRVFWKDKNLTFLGCNAEFARDAGFSDPKDIIGKDDFQMRWRDQAESFRNADRQVIESGCAIMLCEESQMTSEGNNITLLASKMPLRNSNGEIFGVLGVYMDITERKQAEARLQLQSGALEAAANAIVITDSKGVIQWVNPAFTTFTGYTADEAVGKTPSLLKSSKQDQSFYKALWDTILAGKVWHGELINQRKDGSHYTEDLTITPIKDAHGEITHFVGVKQDITERRRMEEKLLQTERMESIGRLASGVAHDLNNILTPIILSTDMLRSTTEEAMRERLISSIEECAQRGASVVSQVLTFARGAKGERATLQVDRLVQDMKKIMEETFPKNINITSAIQCDLWPVSGNSTQIHQVLLNLCINARDAMPEGGTLFVSTANEVIDENFASMVADAKAGNYVLVAISDSGMGIPQEILGKIFDPFFTTKEIGKGTGLGLSTAIGIVRNHGGFVTVESEEGRGSTFKIYLPCEKKGAVEQQVAATSRMPQGNGETILLVEDEEFIAKATSMVLERNGYKVLSASNGNDALALYKEHAKAIKIVLTDVMMPGMNGVVLSQALKVIKPKIKIIASTGHATEAQQAELREQGVKVILRKPYDAKVLLTALRDALDEKAV